MYDINRPPPQIRSYASTLLCIYPTTFSIPIANKSRPNIRFINNEFVKGVDGKTFETINPASEKPIVAVHEATEKDVDIAVEAARKAFEGPWRQVKPADRVKYLAKLADLLEENLELLASIEALDNGKAFNMAKLDVGAAAGCIRYYAGWADKIEGKVIDTNPDTFSYTRQEPVRIHLFLEHMGRRSGLTGGRG